MASRLRPGAFPARLSHRTVAAAFVGAIAALIAVSAIVVAAVGPGSPEPACPGQAKLEDFERDQPVAITPKGFRRGSRFWQLD
jgi:hypothetical protein